jgi:hypothetical protein
MIRKQIGGWGPCFYVAKRSLAPCPAPFGRELSRTVQDKEAKELFLGIAENWRHNHQADSTRGPAISGNGITGHGHGQGHGN